MFGATGNNIIPHNVRCINHTCLGLSSVNHCGLLNPNRYEPKKHTKVFLASFGTAGHCPLQPITGYSHWLSCLDVHSWNHSYVLPMLLLFVCAVYAGTCEVQ